MTKSEENRIRALEERVDKIEELLRKETKQFTLPLLFSNPDSLQGKVVEAVIELIRKKDKNVTNMEILEYLDKKDIDLGENDTVMLAAILGQEVNKKTARLKRVARGLYTIK